MPAAVQHQSKAANISASEKARRFPPEKTEQATRDVAKLPMDLLQKYMKMKEDMTAEEKKQLLIGLRKTKENAMTPSPQEPMWLAEDEPNMERNVVAKKFAIDGEFDPYVNQQRGIQFAPKELDAIRNFQNFATPTAHDPFMVRYEETDDFGNNTTTVVKKHRQGNQFVFTAFTKYDNSTPEPEPEEQPSQALAPQTKGKQAASAEKAPSMPKLKELATPNPDGKIMITKTVAFTDEVEGADVLADFLRTLDI